MARFVVFLDDGGVISDNSVRGPQWQRLVGEFFAPVLGGNANMWAEANRVFTASLFEPSAWEARLRDAGDYWSFERIYFLDWLGGMCAQVGIERPSEEECLRLGQQANAWIIPQIRASFRGAADAIRTLQSRGYELHTASGESSADLEGYLGGMGVRECFGRLYGPDLINTLKAGPEYYERVLADAGVAGRDAIIVDDNPIAIKWAAQAGAQTVLVAGAGYQARAVPGVLCTVSSLAELPGSRAFV